MGRISTKVFFKGQKYEMSARDSQRSKVYKAERNCFRTCDGTNYVGVGPWRIVLGDGTLKEAEDFVKQVARSRTWKKLMISVGRSRDQNWIPPVKDKRSGCATGSPFWGLELPKWSRSKPVIRWASCQAMPARSWRPICDRFTTPCRTGSAASG